MNLSLINQEKLALLPRIGREILEVLLPNRYVETYVVGGGVRDLILNRPTIDIDILIVAEPTTGLPLILEELTKKFLKVQLTQELTDYLTAKVLVGNDIEEIEIDLVFARNEHFLSPGEKAQVVSGTLESDIKRRDFSINALALKASENGQYSVLDIVDGLDDMKEKKLKILHEHSFQDDPIRILRGLRFCLRLDFDFEDKTSKCLEKAVMEKHMLRVSLGRRIFELGKFSSEPDPFLLLSKTNDLKILTQALSVESIVLPSHEKYQGFISSLDCTLGFWAYLLSSLGPLEKELISVLPLKKAERKLVFDAIGRGA